MKNNKRLLTCTLGLMLGVGILTGCGATKEYTVTFKRGNEELHTEIVKDGEKCPEYTPEPVAEYNFMGWYENRQHTGDPFDFNTPIKSDLTLYAWYKEQFKPSTDSFFVVGSFVGGAWDGQAGAPKEDTGDVKGWADRMMTLNQAELANEHNVFEYTIEAIEYGEKFRMIKSTDGLVSDGWTDAYGFDIVNKIYDVDGTEIAKAEAVKEEDSKNIGILIPGKIKVSLDLNSTFNPVGEITLTYIEKRAIVFPEFVGLVGVIGGENLWPSDATPNTDVAFTTEDEGRTWTLKVTLAAGDQVKIRSNHAWAISWGWSAVTSAPEGFAEATEAGADGTVKGNGNIACSVAGEYIFTFVYLSNAITITAA